ncbi:hypothetical protein Rt10032_c07g3190 [Rhodotorula toruloides]|uniref:Zn(2)-C6 fungal-type domain-containing protein n=1 Tax=Rhodotorula toruloides TaxID=5286 RepID=A0A511KFL5_RHOTO|nr:hypothetical protein Rt10032_c07g3190 [Rhodotorula toruloides]
MRPQRMKREDEDDAPYQPRGRGARRTKGRSDEKERPKRRQPCDHCKSTRHRCIISSVSTKDEDDSDSKDGAKDQDKLPCDACIASGRECTYGVLEVDWQGRKRSYGILSEMDERLAKLEVLVLRKIGAATPYELENLDGVLAKVGPPQPVTHGPPRGDTEDGIRRRPAKLPPPPHLPPHLPLPPAPRGLIALSVDHEIAFAQDLFEVASSFWPPNPLASGLTWRKPFLQLDGAAEELASALSSLDVFDVQSSSQRLEHESRPRTLPKLSMPATSASRPLGPVPKSARPLIQLPARSHAWTPLVANPLGIPPPALYLYSLPTPVASPVTPVKTVSITNHFRPLENSPPPDSCLRRYFSAPVLPISPPPSIRSTRSRTSTSSSSGAWIVVTSHQSFL